jgi:CubicO group peptidase (beta-lactamase class C family)
MRSLIHVLVLCLLAAPVFAEQKDDTAKPAQSIEELRQQLEKVLKDTHTPGVSVAIVHSDGPEWVAGLGKADVAADRAATADTLFRIGSTSKSFTSLAILKLVSEGKLSLEDPVRKLVPEVWFENRWEATDPVRVVNLLEHTTGWDDIHLREYALDAPGMGLREALDYDHHSRTSRWRPGTRFAYCNTGPGVAAYIVEKITGERFEDYVAKNLFGPIDMKTATYFQPAADMAVTLYHDDGKTPRPYWNIIYRPSGAINASANDMAKYVLFYLNRGAVKGVQVIPAASIERMESPASTWAAKEGLKAGYGLSNYWNVRDGFVYHGHNGAVNGGLTELAYMPEYGVGYFYSINSGNYDAYDEISKILRAYITRKLQKPAPPPVGALAASASEYAGWYEPDSPRAEMTRLVDRLQGMTHVRIEDGKLLVTGLGGSSDVFLPVTGKQFLQVPKKDAPDPIPTVELLAPNAEGQFIALGPRAMMTTMKRIPTWFAFAEIVLTAFVALAMASIVAYAPFWILGGLSERRRRPAERAMRIWPLLAVLSVAGFVLPIMLAGDEINWRLGALTGWSLTIFLATIAYAVASVASAIAVWQAKKDEVRGSVRVYSALVSIALLIAAAYFFYWGIIGLRTWA